MSKIFIEPVRARKAVLQMDLLAAELKVMEGGVSIINRNLRYKIAAREAIKARLNEVAAQLAEEGRRVGRMRNGLEEITGWYVKTENSNLEKLVAKASGIASSAQGGNPPLSGEDLLKTPAKDMDSFISDFEKKNPEVAKQFNKFLSGGKNNQISEEDIRNIKYLAYNAEEPYRSIYLKNLSKFKISNADLNGGAYYKPVFHNLNYSYPDDFKSDPRGPYTTVFHECGHAIDDLSDETKWWGSDTENFKIRSDAMGKEVTLREAIEYDVYYNTNNPHSVTSIANQVISEGKFGSRGNVDKVIAAFKSGNTSRLSNDDLNLYNVVINQHNRTTGKSAQYEAVSDVYGGVSHNALRTNYGHDTDYWNNKNNAGMELWAEFYSYNMARDTENLAYLKEYFPESAKVLEGYAHALAD